MFQNIADMDNHSEELEKNSSNVMYRLKEIFKYQNIIIYVLTFLMSTLSVKGEFAPFGLAMMAACVGETVPIIGVFVVAIIGTFVGNGLACLGDFVAISIIYFILVLLFKAQIAVEERNELIKTGGKLFAASLIVSIAKSALSVFTMYDVFIGIVTASMTYVFYKIFVNGLAFIKELNVKKAFTIEELIAGVLIVSLASIAFNSINIFSLNLSNIIITFMIMVLGWKHGMLVGAVTGISVGLGISFVDTTSFVQISMFAISGILSGALNKFGKIGVILGFILGNAILTYWVRGATTMVIYFREIFIASIGLLLVPSKIKLDLEDLLGKDKLLDNSGDRRLEGETEVSEKLKTIAEMFGELTKNSDKSIIAAKENITQDFLDNLEELKHNIFYEEIADEENGIARDICSSLLENDILVDKDLISILENHNNYVVMKDNNIRNDLQEIVKIANRTLKTFQINLAKEQERRNNLKTFNESLKTVTKVIDKCADEIKESNNPFYKKEQEITVLLKNKNINVESCNVKLLKNGKYIIELKLDYNDLRLRDKNIMINIGDVVSKSIGTKVTLQRERNNEEENEYYQVYSSEDKFVLQVGSSKITKENSEVSGDCSLQIKLADGKYLLAIADGMGSGEKARECSKITLRLMKQMLSAGFNKEESIEMINSRINLLGTTERYSTLDASILDLYTGKLEILKNGACFTYIKNKKNIKKIESSNIPIGIMDKIEVKTETVDINDGDIIVMCTDGVLDSKEENSEWIEDFLKNISTNNVQKIADLLLAEAVDNSYGVVRDDMTVIVSKIVKRK
ncbi:MAG: SpoIIE family protein phosphatase [Clostridia bacterium]|nr:SpoIIE family protein phosphatase [Clostridia bacterium]